MGRMRAGGALVVAALVAAVLAVPAHSATRIDVAVLLPNLTTSRWHQQDLPALRAALRTAGLRATFANAHGSAATQHRQARAALAAGAKVLILTDVDEKVGAGRRLIREAHDKGARVIDYDRFTPGGLADFFVSYDNSSVGLLQGNALVRCITATGVEHPVVAMLNGDRGAVGDGPRFYQGYDGVLQAHFRSGDYTAGPVAWTTGWDPARAGTLFAAMLDKTEGRIDAVAAANDDLAHAAIKVLRARGHGKIPVTGQDATPRGLQHILTGEQCMTVLKASRKEAAEAVRIARAYVRGSKVTSPTTFANTPSDRAVPATLLTPVAITRSNLDVVFAAGSVTRGQVCTGSYAALCKSAGV